MKHVEKYDIQTFDIVIVKEKRKSCLRDFYTYCTSDSLIGAITNLCNATIGVGILFLPSVLKTTGFILGLSLLMIGGLVESITLYLLYKAYAKLREIDPNIKDYEQIGKYCFGEKTIFGYFISYLIQITIFILNLGGTISFTIIISDSFQFIRNYHPYIHALVLAIVMLVATMISLFPKIASLRFTSYISMIVYFSFLILVIVSYFTKSTVVLNDYHYWPENVFSVISTLGIIIFSFSCHTILCPIVSQFEEKNQWKVGTFGVFGSALIDYLFYCVVALFGYLCFGDYTEGDLILSFQAYGNIPSISSVLTGLIAFSVFASYPLCIYVARYTICNLLCDLHRDIFRCCGKKKEEEMELLKHENGANQTNKSSCEKSCFSNFVLTLVASAFITLVSYLFAIFYPKANVVFGLVGSTGAIFTVYFFPCLFYLIIYHKDLKWYDCRRVGVIIIGVFGGVFGVFVTIATIVNLFL